LASLLLLLLLWLQCAALVVLQVLTHINLWLLLWLLLCCGRSNTNEASKGSPDACLAPIVSLTRWLQAYAVVCCCWDEDAPQRIHQPSDKRPAQHKRQHNKQHNMCKQPDSSRKHHHRTRRHCIIHRPIRCLQTLQNSRSNTAQDA
jgi:hypothetical protein